MTSYLFVFGRTPMLSFLELQSFFPDARLVTQYIARIECTEDLPVDSLIGTLGGTVKITKIIQKAPDFSEDICVSILEHEARNNHMTFGLSRYGDRPAISRDTLSRIKDRLEQSGVRTRFVEPHEGRELSSVVIAKEHVCELTIVQETYEYLYTITVAVQPFEQWNMRDRGRPFADPKAGMLPPKVARMVVNIALGSNPSGKMLLDPFCGMGTILAEATLCGSSCIGSDQQQSVVEKSKANLAWLASKYPYVKEQNIEFFVSDATHVSEHLTCQSVDTVVTEPYMGSTDLGDKSTKTVSREKVKNLVRGLEKLYIGCLRDWKAVLKPGGIVIMALPAYQLDSGTLFVKKVIDTCENLGYTTLHGPIEYSRPQAIVKREFYIFRTYGTH